MKFIVTSGRVRRWRRRHPLPSERHVLVSSHAAQVSVNASRKTRGCPPGLGVNLGATTAEPAPEMTSVAAVAPARAVATPPTFLQHSLRRLADVSRPPTPEGSQPACAWEMTPYPPHYGAAFACSLVLDPQPHRSALRPRYPEGRATGLPRSADITERVRSCLWAGGTTSAAGER